ncbi:MAG TPA: hemerythrin domain-containing protein [Syntrophomonadaceae bacterium]|nr:hemerythrin domain-containing protein [Syntrophomonadaceae bacterium]
MKATEQLKKEHSAVLLMLQVLEKLAEQIGQGDLSPAKDLPAVIDFLKGFVDRCHHGKEEEWLFPALEAAGIPRQAGPVGVMLHEHEAGRLCIREMLNTLDRLETQEGRTALQEAAQNYIQLLRTHITKENEVLFKIADLKLTAAQQDDLYEKFEQLELERMGPGQHEEYHKLLHQLMEKYGVKDLASL